MTQEPVRGTVLLEAKIMIPYKMRTFLIPRSALEGLINGKLEATNIPKDATLFKIERWKPDESAHSVLHLWYTHPDFESYQEGMVVAMEWIQIRVKEGGADESQTIYEGPGYGRCQCELCKSTYDKLINPGC